MAQTTFAQTSDLQANTITIWETVQKQNPLIQCVTNTVVQQFTANILLAGGGAPAMVDIPGEAEVFATIANATLINLGTIAPFQQEAMRLAAAAAHDVNTPWVLDPVAIGALPVRTRLAQSLLEYSPTVIRGNASEIIALAGGSGGRGVDATATVETAAVAAQQLAHDNNCVVAVSGPTDLITDGERTVQCDNGSELLTRVTGAGCALGAYMAAFVSVASDPLQGAAAASACYGVAAEVAAKNSAGYGSFAVNFLDALGNLSATQLETAVNLAWA